MNSQLHSRLTQSLSQIAENVNSDISHVSSWVLNNYAQIHQCCLIIHRSLSTKTRVVLVKMTYQALVQGLIVSKVMGTAHTAFYNKLFSSDVCFKRFLKNTINWDVGPVPISQLCLLCRVVVGIKWDGEREPASDL